MRWICSLLLPVVLMSPALAQDGKQQTADIGTCKLESGQSIEHCRIGYRTFGTLNADRSNAVLMLTWLNGRTEDLLPFFGSEGGGKPGSPQVLVDTSKYFGVAIDALGDGVSSSPSNAAEAQHGAKFPIFSMLDVVRAEYRLATEVLHLDHVHALTGMSMGGEQVFAWAVEYPKYADLAVPIVGTPQVTAYDLISKHLLLDAIRSDPDYKDGNYTAEPQLALANTMNALMVTTPTYRNAVTPRGHVDEWLNEAAARQRQDANDRAWQIQAILRHDVLRGKSIAEVAKSVQTKFYVIVAAQDRMVTPQPALEWAAATHAPAYVSLGTCAHIIMSCDAESVSSRVRQFLDTGK